MVHGNLRAENVLLDENLENAKLSDYGESFKAAQNHNLYTPPEVLHGSRFLPTSDVWGVGCLLLEMCTAERVWNWICLK